MSNTARLSLPLIAAEQAEKHVTHNEALLLLDAAIHLRLTGREETTPPTSPELGQTYAIPATATGTWSGHEGELASWTAGGWRFLTPQTGWMAWDETASSPLVFEGDTWRPLLANIGALGIGTVADDTNRLAVRTEAALFTSVPDGDGGNGNLRLTLNKETTSDSATLIFQSGWSGRAEIGLAGDDNFAFKVSPDGSDWKTALTLDAASGFVRCEQLFGTAISYPAIESGVLAVATSHVVPTPETGPADDIETIAGGFDGALLIIAGTTSVTLTFKSDTGNLRLSADRVLDSAVDSLMLVRRGGAWIELSYANNA